MRPLRAGVVAAGYVAATVILTWPLFSDPSRSVLDGRAAGPFGELAAADIHLMIWGLAWDAHALAREPGRLFHGNVLHPAPLALAGTDHYLGHVPLHAPAYAATGNPVLAYQLNLLLSFALSGAAVHLLLRSWGLPVPAAVLGGVAYAFAPIRSGLPIHGHLVAGQYLPLALCFVDRTLRSGRRRDAAALASLATLQMLCSAYVAYMTAAALAAYVAAAALRRGGAGVPGAWRRLSAALALAIAVHAAASLPYLAARDRGVIPSYEDTALLDRASSHPVENYLVPPVLRRTGRVPLSQGSPSYVGLVALAAAGVALAGRRRMPATAPAWAVTGGAAVAVVSWVLSLGPRLHVGGLAIPMPYALLSHVVPGFSAMRSPGRFALVAQLGVAMLAGLGAARAWDALVRRGRIASAAGVTLALALAVAEYDLWPGRLAITRLDLGESGGEIVRELARRERGPVLEIPAGSPRDLRSPRREGAAMVRSTQAWYPLLNGYSGHVPPSYWTVMGLAQALPDPRALHILQRATGLRYVIVRLDARPRPEARAWHEPPGLRLLRRSGPELLFETVASPPADLMGALLSPVAGRTLAGARAAPLPPADREGVISFPRRPPATTLGSLAFETEVTVENRSSVVWPALGVLPDHLVRPGVRWRLPDGRVLEEIADAGFVSLDLAPGERCRAFVGAAAPPGHERLLLEIGLTQDGTWFPGTVTLALQVLSPRSAAAAR